MCDNEKNPDTARTKKNMIATQNLPKQRQTTSPKPKALKSAPKINLEKKESQKRCEMKTKNSQQQNLLNMTLKKKIETRTVSKDWEQKKSDLMEAQMHSSQLRKKKESGKERIWKIKNLKNKESGK